MKRTIPLLITSVVGFVLIVSYFTPEAEEIGERVTIWFDILAAIAFILGGGNLLKVHLGKISSQQAGWGYSGITLIAFLATLYVGLVKVGSPPLPQQEFYGESFAELPVADLPDSQVFRVSGSLPEKPEPVPPSVRRHLSEDNGELVFRGWMSDDQKSDLAVYHDRRAWRATVDELAAKAQPPESLQNKIRYRSNHSALSFEGRMTDEDRAALDAMGDGAAWKSALDELQEKSRRETRHPLDGLPDDLTIPDTVADVSYDGSAKELVVFGPMSDGQRTALKGELSAGENQQSIADAAAELLQLPAGADVSGPQQEALDQFGADEEASAAALLESLKSEGGLTDDQETLVTAFLASQPTIADRKKTAFAALARTVDDKESLEPMRDPLLADYFEKRRWEHAVDGLYYAAHETKYPWSGAYRATGSPFWWLYEYAFKPLTATMFAMLAFYVASAAFRAFRAKNVEAILLLGTAFIILLGRTFAGVLLTDWLPESLEGLKISNLTVTIMQVFNTAGNRAIMIGIALGIASTSLKVLLGVDRSYLGSGEE